MIPITVNIALDAVFIFALGWGVAGSAAATLACQFTSVAMAALFFAKFSLLPLGAVRPRLARVPAIFSVGVPSLVQMGSLSLLFALANNQINRVKQTVRLCAVVAAVYAVCATLLAEAIPAHLVRIFTDDPVVTAYGARGVRFVAASLVLLPFPLLLGATLQAKGKRLSSTFFYAAHFLAFVPLAFTLPSALGADGMWIAYLSAAAVAAVVSLLYTALSPRYPAAPPYTRLPRFPKMLDNPPPNG